MGTRFCSDCGAPLAEALPENRNDAPASGLPDQGTLVPGGGCQRCGSPNDEDAEFCVRCGGRLLVECPQWGAANRAALAFCASCGFDYSRFVAQRVIDALGTKEAERRPSVKAGGFSSAVIFVLVIFSILIAIYILRQI